MFAFGSLEERRNKFFAFIRSNRPHGSLNNAVMVVFDCKAKHSYEESGGYFTSHIGEIEVIFSGGILSADDIIAQKCDEADKPLEITVITNDKGIRRRIAPSGARYESAESFIAKGFKKKNAKRSAELVSKEIRKEINEELEKLWL
jgi:predicted RNA-binding protein with PIN domain